MPLHIISIVILFTILNISSFIIGFLRTPQYTEFLGTVHFAIDYFCYLSYIIQGKTHWFMGTSLFSGETTAYDFHNWIYVLFGHIFSPLPPYVTYQIMVVIGSVLYLVVSYTLLSYLFPTSKWKATLSWVLFLLSNALPRIHNIDGPWVFSYYYPWNNYGHPFIRLTNVPSHLIIQTLLFAILLLILIVWKQQRPKWQYCAVLTILGFLLSSLQPVQWALVCCAVFVSVGIVIARTGNWRVGLIYSIPLLCIGVGGLIPGLYLRYLTTTLPLSMGAQWESWQQIRISFLHFIRLNGPLFILTLVGIPYVLRSLSSNTVLLTSYTLLSVGLLFTDIPQNFHILNLRFHSSIPTLYFAYISTLLIVRLSKGGKRIAWIIALLVMAITIPVTIKHLQERVNFTANDPNVYLPLGARMAFDKARELSTEQDIFLILAPFHTTFPGMTGRRVYVAYEIGTVDFKRKQQLGSNFYNNRMTDDEKRAFLTNENISYIFAYAWGPIKSPNITEVYKNDYMILYKVTP